MNNMGGRLANVTIQPAPSLPARLFWLSAVAQNGYGAKKDSDLDIIARALSAGAGADVFVAYAGGRLAGACSYRREEQSVKRINTGVVEVFQRCGVGSKLVEAVCRVHPDMPQYCHSLNPMSWAWCEALGMQHLEDLQDGRRKYFWSVEGIHSFLRRR